MDIQKVGKNNKQENNKRLLVNGKSDCKKN